MSTYRCDAGHTTERLTECTGFRNPALGIHTPPIPGLTEQPVCACGAGPAPAIHCPATLGRAAPDALTIPPMCGRPASLLLCTYCQRPAAKDICDDCWHDLTPPEW